MIKLMELEWRKLEQKKVLGEVITYWVILMFFPVLFLDVIAPKSGLLHFGQSYSDAITLMAAIQMGLVLFGASLINHVFIEEYKNKTISLSFGYPISRKKLVMAKVLFIGLTVFVTTLISFVLSGITTYVFDVFLNIIGGEPTWAVLMSFLVRMVIYSAAVALISLVPLFLFGVWKRAVIPTVLCAILLMQLPNYTWMIHPNLQVDGMYALFSVLGVISVIVAIFKVDQVGDM